MQPDGISLMAAVKGKELEKRTFFWEHHQSRAVYHDGWKLVADKKLWKLYDLKNDPGEKSDLSKQYPERAEELKAMWTKWGTDYGVIRVPSNKKKKKKKI